MSEEESTSDNSGEGNINETTEIIEQQRQRIEELEIRETERIKEEAKRQLGGRSEAGQAQTKTEEELKSEAMADDIVKAFK